MQKWLVNNTSVYFFSSPGLLKHDFTKKTARGKRWSARVSRLECTRSPRPVDRGRPQCSVSYPDNNSASHLLRTFQNPGVPPPPPLLPLAPVHARWWIDYLSMSAHQRQGTWMCLETVYLLLINISPMWLLFNFRTPPNALLSLSLSACLCYDFHPFTFFLFFLLEYFPISLLTPSHVQQKPWPSSLSLFYLYF